ncbi:MAG: T9SS type A sorting domain-containing protein [Paludibacter sp.]|jgi:hypothetical protein|nr:T9SS type A sorting domain-containing protein [Paludibacter sp.]
MKTKLLFIFWAAFSITGAIAQTLTLPGTEPWIIDDFEGDSAVAVNWNSADGGSRAIVTDPFDPTNKVLRYVRKSGGQIWDGPIRSFNVDDPTSTGNLLPSKYQVGTTGLPKYQYVVFRALKSTPGELVAKVEFKGLTPVQQYGSEHLPNDPPSRVGKWQWFIFNLADKTKSRSSYDLVANNDKNGGYNVFLIQPDRSSGGNTDTTYIDDIYFTNTPPVIPIDQQKIAGFSALATDFKIVLKWNKMEVADKYIIKMNGQQLAVIDDNRVVSHEMTYEEAGMQPGIKYEFSVSGANNSGLTTDGESLAYAYRLKAAEDFSWVLAEDFEKDFYKWTRWQDGSHQEYLENPVKGAGNMSDRVLRLTRTPGDSLAYGAQGRTGNSNTFVTFTVKNYFQVPMDSSSTNEEAFKYFQMQMHSPVGNGLPVVKIGGLTLDPIVASRQQGWVKDSVIQATATGTVKSYFYRNSRPANQWVNFVYKFTKGMTNVSQIEILPDNTFENTKRTQEIRNYYVDNLIFSMTADPVVISSLPSNLVRKEYNMFVHGNEVIFDLPSAQPVSLRLFDISGRSVAVLADKATMFEGINSMQLPELNSGVYIVELRTASGTQSLKLIR